jgi:heat shock protein HslJ
MGLALLMRAATLASSLALAAQGVPGPRPLAGTYWKAIELAGTPVPLQGSNHEAYLVLQQGGRVYGSDGCNQVAGTYRLKHTAVTFGEMAATRMACIDAGGIDAVFRDALKSARRLTVAGDRLELLDSSNKRVAMFLAVSGRPADPGRR